MTTITAIKRAAGYFRVSTAHQTGERHSSLETQEARFRDYCRRNNLQPQATFADVVSGRRDDRKEYRRLVEYALGGNVDAIVVQFLDRFGRNPREILRRYWELEEHGVTIVATDEDIHEELILLLKAGMAGAESRRTSERVRAYMGNAVSKGVHAAIPPYGLRPNRVLGSGRITTTWEIHPEEAPVVREMYRLAVEENLGYKAIGDRLSAMGYKARKGGPFTAFSVQRVLNNPAIMGQLTYGRKPRKGNPTRERIEVPNFFPPILSGIEWERLQSRLAIRKESPKGQAHSSTYLLSGMVRCGHCGGAMVGSTGGIKKSNPQERYRNYWCSWAKRSRALCEFFNGHSAARLEAAILEYLGQYSDPEKVRELLATSERRDLARYENELARVQSRLKELEAGMLNDLDRLDRNVITEAEFTSRSEARRTETATLERRKAELTEWVERERSAEAQVQRVPQAIGTFLKDFQTLDVRQAKAMLQTILKAAYIWRDGRIEVEFRG